MKIPICSPFTSRAVASPVPFLVAYRLSSMRKPVIRKEYSPAGVRKVMDSPTSTPSSSLAFGVKMAASFAWILESAGK